MCERQAAFEEQFAQIKAQLMEAYQQMMLAQKQEALRHTGSTEYLDGRDARIWVFPDQENPWKRTS